MLTDLNWSGVKRLEADEIALLQDGRAVDIHDAFVNEHQIASVVQNTVPVGGGITYTELAWPEISDTKVPGLKSILDYMAQQSAGSPSNDTYNITVKKRIILYDNPVNILYRKHKKNNYFSTHINSTTAVVRKRYTTLNRHIQNALYSTNNQTVVKRTFKTINNIERPSVVYSSHHHTHVRRHTTNRYKRLTVLDNTSYYLLPMSKIASLERRVAALEVNG